MTYEAAYIQEKFCGLAVEAFVKRCRVRRWAEATMFLGRQLPASCDAMKAHVEREHAAGLEL
eukprot:6187563-Pleurochrysis_carterae.AAC.8